jgi:hypothetical protein
MASRSAGWSLRPGRRWAAETRAFYTILGYETTPAPENFFYSHSYCLIYGEPVNETGLLGEKKFGNFKIQAGLTRGWDNWEDNNNDSSWAGCWTDDDERPRLRRAVGQRAARTARKQNNRNVFSFVFQQKSANASNTSSSTITARKNCSTTTPAPRRMDRPDQYLFYTINDVEGRLRFEWFHDRDGIRLTGGRQAADYYELTAGLNWKPHSRVTVRPEIRYDWVRGELTLHDAMYQLLLGGCF